MSNLVGDKIPVLIRAAGRACVTTSESGPYRADLRQKPPEEVDELIAGKDAEALIEEVADVLELLTAMGAEHQES